MLRISSATEQDERHGGGGAEVLANEGLLVDELDDRDR